MSHFKLINKVKLHELEMDKTIPESDFATLSKSSDGDVFLQFSYVETEEKVPVTKVKPGIWAIATDGPRMVLRPTSFNKDKILDEFVSTKHIEEKIERFFSRIQVYYDHGYDVPKRAMLLFGPAGSGKSTLINKIAMKYNGDSKTVVVTWPTDKFRAGDVKEFIKGFEYETSVERLIFVVEDIGGVEVDQTRIPSDPSLLALLDNQEKSFKIPTLVLATTNYPESFLANITNRPQRFDDKIEVPLPPAEARGALLKFFSRAEVSDADVQMICSTKCKDFTPAHVKEAVIRSAIYEQSLSTTFEQMITEIEKFKKAFTNAVKIGF